MAMVMAMAKVKYPRRLRRANVAAAAPPLIINKKRMADTDAGAATSNQKRKLTMDTAAPAERSIEEFRESNWEKVGAMAHYRLRPRIGGVVAPPLIINKKRKFATADAAATQRRKFTTEPERSIDEFEMLNKIGEGAYGVVYRARDKKTKEIVAMKKVDSDDREANILTHLNHRSIVDLKHAISSSSSVFLVMEYVENDVRSLLDKMKQPFSQSEVKCLMQQLLQGVDYLHRNQILHRDLKTSNLLLNNRGELKICDFGLACKFKKKNIPNTETVVTLWYRAPELLLGVKEYSAAVDMWSVGCIMAELLSRQTLFEGDMEMDQLGKIFKILGNPNETIWPGFSKLPGVKGGNFIRGGRRSLLRQRFPVMSFTAGTAVLSNAGFDLLSRLLTYDPQKRITAEEALNHSWFHQVPLPKSKDFMKQTGTGLFDL